MQYRHTSLCCVFLMYALNAADLPRKEQRQKVVRRIVTLLEDRLAEVEKRAGLGQETPSRPSFAVSLSDHLHFRTPEGRFDLYLGGLTQNDWAFMTQSRSMRNRVGAYRDGTEFLRARILVGGLILNRFTFKAQYDFAGGQAAFKDVYLGVVKLPLGGRLLVGQMKEPFSLDILTAAGNTVFLRRSTPATAFAPNRNTGILLDEAFLENPHRLGLQVGLFHDTDLFGSGVNDQDGAEYSVATRLFGAPVWSETGSGVLFGAAYRYAQPPGDEVRFSSRPEAHLAPTVIDTGIFGAKNLHQADVHTICVVDRLWAQSEYIYTLADRPWGSDAQFSGVTVAAGVFLTGETRPVRRGVFARVLPRNNFSPGSEFFEGKALGAWELAGRWSFVGLNDRPVRGGKLSTATAALNWYLNPYCRLMLNYVCVKRRCHGEAHIVQWRFQLNL